MATWLLFYDAMSAVRGSPALHLIYITYICIYHIYFTMSYPAVGTGDAPDIAGEAGRGQEPGGQQETQTRPHHTSLLQSPFCSDLSAVISLQSPFCSDLSAFLQ